MKLHITDNASVSASIKSGLNAFNSVVYREIEQDHNTLAKRDRKSRNRSNRRSNRQYDTAQDLALATEFLASY